MVLNYFHNIVEILPAIIGFSITGIFILTSVFSVKFPEYNENPPGILISSFIFIVSGFLFEIIYDSWPSIQCWAENHQSIAFVFTISGTLFTGFCTNGFSRKLADDKEKREISVLFRNSIDSQVKSLKIINLYLSFALTEENINCMKIYKNNLLTSKAYDTALNKIGIYDEKDTDIISKYSNELQQCFNYIERFLIELDEHIQFNETHKKTHINEPEYQPQHERTLIIVKIAILTTSISGIFTSYYLSKRYLNNNLGKLQDEFFNYYEEILDKFKEELRLSEFNIMNRVISSDLFDKLKYIRNNFIESSNNYNVSSRKPIYLCRLIIKEPVGNFGVADFGYDFDLLAIAQLLHYQYFRLLDFYFHTLIQQRPKLPKLYINHTDDIVTFGESPEDVKNNCNSIIEDLKNKHNLETEIQYSDIIPEIISPWK
ncbi:hypothetical protein [Anabaena sp. PCC 7108]|uniref:hypothetical protein n=1 Tax=Anabaena sp. PCC 7108 TaxID=163908 RepID=UPI0003474AB0|nr:hypothetical protein [Anabaena sp. PCC 7108]